MHTTDTPFPFFVLLGLATAALAYRLVFHLSRQVAVQPAEWRWPH